VLHEWVVAEFLDDGAFAGIGMGLPHQVYRKSRISLDQEILDLIGPCQVHDLLVPQNRICGATAATHEYDYKKCHRTD
jgi:hypothetical protein